MDERDPLTHVALCLGRLEEITDPALRDRVARAFGSDSKEPILIEALLGRGTVLTPFRHYREHAPSLLCRPRGLSKRELQEVSYYAMRHLGDDYDFRQLISTISNSRNGSLPMRVRPTSPAH